VFEQSMGEDCVETLVLKWKLINACLAKFDIQAFAFGLFTRFCKSASPAEIAASSESN